MRADWPDRQGCRNISNAAQLEGHSAYHNEDPSSDCDTIETASVSESEYQINIDDTDSDLEEAGPGLDQDVSANTAWPHTMHGIQVSPISIFMVL